MLKALGPHHYWGLLTPPKRELVHWCMINDNLTFAEALEALVEAGM
jgi:hypothetical protein